MKRILKALWFTPGLEGRWGLPAIFTGAPGSGKSTIMRHAANSAGLYLETVLASLRQPEDFLGLPIPAKDEATREQLVAWMRGALPSAEPLRSDKATITFAAVTYAPPRWATRLALAGRGVCFLDEINSAPPAVQAALLRVALEGVVGDLTLPPGIRFIAAMNPTEEAAGGWDLAAPLANRFAHLQWALPDLDAWSEFMIGSGRERDGNGAAESEEARATSGWPGVYPQAIGAVSAFLRARRGLFLDQPKAGDTKSSGAWPSPRTWSYAVHALAAGQLHGLDPMDGEALVAGFVGQGPANELATFREKLDLPDPQKLLDGEIEWKHNPIRLDRSVAVLASASAFLAQSGAKVKGAKERGARFWKIMVSVAANAADVVIPAVRALTNAGFSAESAEASIVLNKVFPVVDTIANAKKGR